MSYADKDKERTTTRKRVQKHRAKQKGVTGVTPQIVVQGIVEAEDKAIMSLTEGVTCKLCDGRGFTELEHGLIQVQCKCQVKKNGPKDSDPTSCSDQ